MTVHQLGMAVGMANGTVNCRPRSRKLKSLSLYASESGSPRLCSGVRNSSPTTRARRTLDLDLADSITTWRLSASRRNRRWTTRRRADVAAPSFQPFFVELNLPVALTRGDEVTVPVVVYNYLDKPQTC